MSLININNVTLAYEGQPVVRGLSFSVEKGEYLCVVGENGSGKSTVIKALCGLVSPKEGQIEFEGGRTKIGYLPQQAQIQKDFPATVYEVIVSGFTAKNGLSPFFGKKVRQEVMKIAKKLSVEDLLPLSYRDLSGGQQQRVLLARALSSADRIIILDEPITGLDRKSAADMYDIIDSLHEEGMTVIMISHDIAEAVKRADSILNLSDDGFFICSAEEYAERSSKHNCGEGE